MSECGLFWVGGGRWENILGWLGVFGGDGWERVGWVHYLIMPIRNRIVKSKIKSWKCEIYTCRLCKEYEPSLGYI